MLLTGFQEDQDAVLSLIMIGFWVRNEAFRCCPKNELLYTETSLPRTKFLTHIPRLKTAVVTDGNQSPPP